MKHTILVGLCLVSAAAHADCYIRSSVRLALQTVNTKPTDMQKLVVPDMKGFKCVLRYRIHIGDEWKTAEGIGYGKTEPLACEYALNLQNGAVLEEVAPSRVRADTQMVCSDLVEIKVRPVRIGETIWDSEADMHRHPDERKPFNYKDTICRMFTERNDKDRNLYTYQGIMCRITTEANSKWRVIDKY